MKKNVLVKALSLLLTLLLFIPAVPISSSAIAVEDIVISNPTDATLRAAINMINAADNGGRITFTNTSPAVIELQSALPNIIKNIEIIGPGASLLTIKGSNTPNAYTLAFKGVQHPNLKFNGVTATIKGITFSGTTRNSVIYFTGGWAANNTQNYHFLTIEDCIFRDNDVYMGGTNGDKLGGAIYADEDPRVVINSSQFINNSCQNYAHFYITGIVYINDSFFTEGYAGFNSVGMAGGADFKNSTFYNNYAFAGKVLNYGWGHFYNCAIINNRAGWDTMTGGFVLQNLTDLSACIIAGNTNLNGETNYALMNDTPVYTKHAPSVANGYSIIGYDGGTYTPESIFGTSAPIPQTVYGLKMAIPIKENGAAHNVINPANIIPSTADPEPGKIKMHLTDIMGSPRPGINTDGTPTFCDLGPLEFNPQLENYRAIRDVYAQHMTTSIDITLPYALNAQQFIDAIAAATVMKNYIENNSEKFFNENNLGEGFGGNSGMLPTQTKAQAIALCEQYIANCQAILDSQFPITINYSIANKATVTGPETISFLGGGTFKVNLTPGTEISSVTYTAAVVLPGETETVTTPRTFTATLNANNEFSVIGIKSPLTIQVNLRIQQFTVTVDCGANGRVNPGTGSVNYGTSPNYTITANANYLIDTLTVNNIEVPEAAGQTEYGITLNNVLSAQSIKVTFRQKKYYVSSKAFGEGTISPDGMKEVAFNSTHVYEINAKPGYLIDSLTVNGVIITAASNKKSYSLSIGPIELLLTEITATFKESQYKDIEVIIANMPDEKDITLYTAKSWDAMIAAYDKLQDLMNNQAPLGDLNNAANELQGTIDNLKKRNSFDTFWQFILMILAQLRSLFDLRKILGTD